MAEALTNDQWVLDLRHASLEEISPDFLRLWRLLNARNLRLEANVEDTIAWTSGRGGSYTSRAAYEMQFERTEHGCLKSLIWKAKAPGKVKMFAWLLHHNRLWCNDRLQLRGWPNSYFCPLCVRSSESSLHLIWDCPFSRAVWTEATSWRHCSALKPLDRILPSSTEICRSIVRRTEADHRKGIRSMILMIAWTIWKFRNNCVFREATPTIMEVIAVIRTEMEQWRVRGVKDRETRSGPVSEIVASSLMFGVSFSCFSFVFPTVH